MKKSDTEEYLVHDHIYMKLEKRLNESVVIEARARFCFLLWMEKLGGEGTLLTCKTEGGDALAEL